MRTTLIINVYRTNAHRGYRLGSRFFSEENSNREAREWAILYAHQRIYRLRVTGPRTQRERKVK